MPKITTQLPLHLHPQEVYQLDNFYFNQPEIRLALLAFCELTTLSFLYLWGEKASGKSHLLMAVIDRIQTQQPKKRMLYLPLAELVKSNSPKVLESVEDLDLLCLDVDCNSDSRMAVLSTFTGINAFFILSITRLSSRSYRG